MKKPSFIDFNSMFHGKHNASIILDESFNLLQNVHILFDKYRNIAEPKLEQIETVDFKYKPLQEDEKSDPEEEAMSLSKIDLANKSSYPDYQQTMIDLKALNRYGKFKHFMSGASSAPEESVTIPYLTSFTMTLFTGDKEGELPVIESINLLGAKYNDLANKIRDTQLVKSKEHQNMVQNARCLTAFFTTGKIIADHYEQQAQYHKDKESMLFKSVSVGTGEEIEEEKEEKKFLSTEMKFTDEDEKIGEHIDIVRDLIPDQSKEYRQKYLVPNVNTIIELTSKCAKADIYNSIILEKKFPQGVNEQSAEYKSFLKSHLEPFNGLIQVYTDFEQQLFPALHSVDIKEIDKQFEDKQNPIFGEIGGKKKADILYIDPRKMRYLKDDE